MKTPALQPQRYVGGQLCQLKLLRSRWSCRRSSQSALCCNSRFECTGTSDDLNCDNNPEPCRRAILLSAAAVIASNQCQLAIAAPQSGNPPLQHLLAPGGPAGQADGSEELIGKPGFRLRYPSEWVVAYNRDVRNEYNDQRRVIALLGDFARLETASVQWLNPDRLGQTGAVILRRHFGLHFMRRLRLIGPNQPSSFLTPARLAETFDGRDLAAALINEARAVGSTYDLNIINDGSAISNRENYVEFEYVLSVCRGQAEEGREGTRRCIAPNGDIVQPVSRHLLAAATVRRGKGLLCTVSAPTEDWQQCEEKMRAVIRSFELL